MKVVTIAAILAFSTVASVANAEINTSTTRAQVAAELQAAAQAGLLLGGESSVYPMITHSSDESRAQVVAELEAAKQSDGILQGEASVYPSITQGSNLSRAQVLKELKQYARTDSPVIEH
ncbi:DUF4148 domain-containing protein [Alcaligenaceae bacterium]|nr:DUF4148 domain-containing protein [Alcaligenaceae bacterium]